MFDIFSSAQGIILAILALGFLIFIHELGHFLAAKRCGIRVEKFSIGFGPKIFGFTRGETEYCLSLLPFGGFVKMAGENPEERPETQDYDVTAKNPTGEFHTAPVSHRIFVAIAGPAMNILLGFVVFSLVFMIGLDANTVPLIEALTDEPLSESDRGAAIGLVGAESPAAVGGIEPGDKIFSIDGQKINTWSDFNTRIFTSPGRELEIVVIRNGQEKTLTVTPQSHERPGVGQVGEIQVAPRQKVMVGSVAEGSEAAAAGIQAGDMIDVINGQTLYYVPRSDSQVWHFTDWVVATHREYHRKIQENAEVELQIRRGNESLTFNLPTTWAIQALVKPESEATTAGIQSGDTIVGINGESIGNFELYPKLYEFAQTNPGQAVEINLLRNGEPLSVSLTPQLVGDENQLDLRGLHWNTLLSGLELTSPPLSIPQYNVFTAIGKGFATNWAIFRYIVKVLKRLVTREVSPKYLSGPVGIVDLTNRVAKIGFTSLLFFVGFISVNLAIVNLLPIPIADGGQILFFTLEKLRGRPLSLRKQIIIQQVSIVILGLFFLYVTWFDILRVRAF